MKTRPKLRCATCKRRTHNHEPDIMLSRLDTKERVYFHTRCASGATAVTMLEPDVWAMTVRHAEGEAN